MLLGSNQALSCWEMTELILSIQKHVTYHLKSYNFLTVFSNSILGLKARFHKTSHFPYLFLWKDELVFINYSFVNPKTNSYAVCKFSNIYELYLHKFLLRQLDFPFRKGTLGEKH